MIGWMYRLCVLAALLALPASARAQGGVTGSIAGVVLDAAGAPLQGVQLTARSATHIGGDRVAYSGQQGEFRFRNLMPGEFEVAASAPSMRPVRQRGVQVGINASADVVVVMEVRATSDEVKVVERAPLLSRTTAQVKEVYEEKFMDSLPLENRTAIEEFISYNVPGGSYFSRRLTRIRGGNTEQNAFMVDGFFMNRQKTMYKTLSALEVQTAGYGADGATVPGGLITMVTKTGSNKFELDLNGYRDDSNLRPFRDSGDTQYRTSETFLNGNVSGPVLPDRLWYYVNVEARREYQAREADPGGLFPAPAPYRYGNVRGTAKLTWQITPRQRLASFTLINRDYSRNRDAAPSTADDAQFMNEDLDWFSGLTWDALLADNLAFRSQVGFTEFLFQQRPQRCGQDAQRCLDIPAEVQTFPVISKYGNYELINQQRQRGIEFVNTLEWFGRWRTLGEHDIKLVSRFLSRSDTIAEATPGDRILQHNGLVPDRQIEFFSNDPRLEAPRHGYRIGTSTGYRFTTSLQDSARVTRHLTITPGVALSTSRSSNSDRGQVTDFAAVTPHLAAVWDATHDGRTILRGSFNHYVDMDVGRFARLSLDSRVSRTCRWNSATSAYDTDCVYGGGASGTTIGLPCGDTGIAVGRPPLSRAAAGPPDVGVHAGRRPVDHRRHHPGKRPRLPRLHPPVQHPGDEPAVERQRVGPGADGRVSQRLGPDGAGSGHAGECSPQVHRTHHLRTQAQRPVRDERRLHLEPAFRKRLQHRGQPAGRHPPARSDVVGIPARRRPARGRDHRRVPVDPVAVDRRRLPLLVRQTLQPAVPEQHHGRCRGSAILGWASIPAPT